MNVPIIKLRGRIIVYIDCDGKNLIKAGKYWKSIERFMLNNNVSLLDNWIGEYVSDVQGKRHYLQFQPNDIYKACEDKSVFQHYIYNDITDEYDIHPSIELWESNKMSWQHVLDCKDTSQTKHYYATIALNAGYRFIVYDCIVYFVTDEVNAIETGLTKDDLR